MNEDFYANMEPIVTDTDSDNNAIYPSMPNTPADVIDNEALKAKIAFLEAQLAATQQAPTEAPKNIPAEVKQIDFQVGPIDKWVTGGGTKSHIKNPA